MKDLLDQLSVSGTRILRVSRGDILWLPSGTFTVLWPEMEHTRSWSDANDGSLVIRAELNGTSLLLTGDLTGEYEAYVQEPADILKIAHHGSSYSSSPAFLASVGARVLLLSTGREERENSIIERMTAGRLCSTRTAGAVTVRLEPGGRYTVSTYLHPEAEN